MVRHFEDAADIGRLRLVEEEVGLGCIVIDAVDALEESQCDQRIQKIASPAWVESEAALQGLEILRMLRQLGEEFHLNGAEKRLGVPEGEAGLQNTIRSDVHPS